MDHFKFRFILGLFIMGAAFFVPETRAGNLPDSIPRGWRATPDNSPDVVLGADTTVKRSGKASGFVYRAPTPSFGTGTLMQSIAADGYRNKRVRMIVYVKSKEVELAFLYMRVDGLDTSVAFANTAGKSIKETIGWTLFEITLDVPEESNTIVFGAVLSGQGMLWVDDYSLEIVDKSIPSDDWIGSGRVKSGIKRLKPNYPPNALAMNLGFEDR